MHDPTELAERVKRIVEVELPELTTLYDASGYGEIDGYAMALAHLCGQYHLPPADAAKLDDLYHKHLIDRAAERDPDVGRCIIFGCTNWCEETICDHHLKGNP